MKRLALVSALVVALGCGNEESCSGLNCDSDDNAPDLGGVGADVTAVRASGSPSAYTVSVTIRSPDTGCDQYADWWEVLTLEGELVYRRILAHMSDGGYGGMAFTGSVGSGLSADPSLTAEFAPELSQVSPLPSECAF